MVFFLKCSIIILTALANSQNDLLFSLTLESVIDVGQGISVGPGKFDKKNKYRALNKHRNLSKRMNVWP